MRRFERLARLTAPWLSIDEGRGRPRLPRSARSGRVEERLRRDAESALPEPPEELAQRISHALRSEPAAPRVVARRAPPRIGLVLATAALALAALLVALRDREATPSPAEPIQVAVAAPDVHALRAGLEGWLRPTATRLSTAVDARLLDEARLLAGDGERVGRALLSGLPAPLRSRFSVRAE